MKLSLQVVLLIVAVSMPAPALAQGIFETGSVYAKSAGFGAGAGVAAALSGKGTPSAVTNALQRLNAAAAGGGKSAATNGRPMSAPTRSKSAQSETASAALEDWARAEEKQGHKGNAADVYRKLAEQREAAYGEKDGGVRNAALKAGDLYVGAKDWEHAEVSYRKALSSAVRAFGPGNSDLIPTLNKLIDVCEKQGNFRDAESYATQAYGLTEREFGTTDARTAVAKEKLCTVIEGYIEQLRIMNQTEMVAYQQHRLEQLRPSSPAAAAGSVSDATAPGAHAGESTAPAPAGLDANGGQPTGGAAQ